GRFDAHPYAAAVVALPGHPGGELRGPVPREDEVGEDVDETAQHAPRRDVEPLVRGGRRARRAERGDGRRPVDAVAVDDDGVVGAGAGAPFARAVAGEQLADAGDEGAGHEGILPWSGVVAPSHGRRAPVRSSPTSPRRCRPSVTTCSPSTTTSVTSAAAAASGSCSSRVPAVRT